MSENYGQERTAPEGATRALRGTESIDLCKGERSGEVGLTGDRADRGDLAQRTLRKAWAWANLAVGLTGGILDQLIDDVRDQLVAHQESADWYEAEIAKNQSGRDWHLAKIATTQQRLNSLLELQASVTAVQDANDDELDGNDQGVVSEGDR